MSEPRKSIVPENASLRHGDPACIAGEHTGLAWEEDVTHPSPTTTRIRLTYAKCSDCGREQKELRVVYPPDYTIKVNPLNRGETE